MTRHPNRSRHNPRRNPTPEQIRLTRILAGRTPAQAAALIHCSEHTWVRCESGLKSMHPAMWELFGLKIRMALPEPKPVPEAAKVAFRLMMESAERFMAVQENAANQGMPPAAGPTVRIVRGDPNLLLKDD